MIVVKNTLELEKKYNSCVAELHYNAMVGREVKNLRLNEINYSFVNCSSSQEYPSLKKYKELLSYNIEPISFIGLLAGQIRIMYQVKILEKIAKEIQDEE